MSFIAFTPVRHFHCFSFAAIYANVVNDATESICRALLAKHYLQRRKYIVSSMHRLVSSTKRFTLKHNIAPVFVSIVHAVPLVPKAPQSQSKPSYTSSTSAISDQRVYFMILKNQKGV